MPVSIIFGRRIGQPVSFNKTALLVRYYKIKEPIDDYSGQNFAPNPG